MPQDHPPLSITSPAFRDHGPMPKRYTGFGEDISPPFTIDHLAPDAVSLAIILDDLDIPMIPAYNHWLIWDLPAVTTIPERIPHGPMVPSLGVAKQGVAYGHNCYRGPKQPIFIRNSHRYVFHFYALDCFLALDSSARKKDLLAAMNGHILQQGSITGTYRRGQPD